MTHRQWMRGAAWPCRSHQPASSRRTPTVASSVLAAAVGTFCRPPADMASSAPMSALLLLLLLLLAASSSASPVLHTYDGSTVDDPSTTTLHDPSDSTWAQEGVGSERDVLGSVTHSQPTSQGNFRPETEYGSPEELNAVSAWDDDSSDDTEWKFLVSPPDAYEHDEQQPPLAVDKNGAPVDEFTDDPNFSSAHFGDGAANWDEDTASLPDRGYDSKSEQASSPKGEMAEETVPPPRNATRRGPEGGIEAFEESLGAVLNETLRRMKEVLAGAMKTGGQRDHEGVDWRSALSHLRVKRSEGDREDANELPVTSLNDIVDVFLIIARQSLEDRGLDQVSIPSLERTFSRSLGVGTLRGFFRGDDGWVRRLTTVRRVDDVRLDRGPRPPEGEPWDLRTVSVATSLGLQELTVGFERYVADVRALPTVSGRLLADIDENAVLLNISFSKRDGDTKGCDVVLQELEIERLDGINLKLTGLGPLNWLLSRIATWLTNHSQEKVAAVVEKELAQIANKELQNIPCDADFITAISML